VVDPREDKTVCQVSGYNGKGLSFSGAAASAKLTHPLSLQLSDDERFLYVAHGGDVNGANIVQKIDVTPCPTVEPYPQRGQWSLVGGGLVGSPRLNPDEAFVSPPVQLSGPGKGERKVEVLLKIDKYSHVTFGITKKNATELVGVKCNHNVSAGVRSGFVLMPLEDGDGHVARVIRSGACPPLELGTRQHNVVCDGATKVEFVVNRRKPLTEEKKAWWKLGKLSVGGRPLLPGAWTEELEACGDVHVVVGVCSDKAGNGLELTDPPLIFPRTGLY